MTRENWSCATGWEMYSATDEYRELALLTGPDRNGQGYGYTFSDITQRFIPNLLIEAFPDSPVTFQLAKSLIERLEPTAPFGLTEQETKR